MEPFRGFEKTSISFFCKRRFILLFVAVVGLLLFASLRSQHMTLWANREVDEIYGFLHVVLNDSEGGLLSSELKLDLEGDNHISLYDPRYSATHWLKERQRIDQTYPVIVFSKSYCPYSRNAKELLASLELQPPPKIIEVDLREDDPRIKRFLSRLTHHSTFPNILVRGKSLGGSDNLANLHSRNELKPLLFMAGAKSKRVEPLGS